MKPAPFNYHRAASLDHAVELLARFAPEGGRILAGGQSLVPLMALRLAQPTHLIDINRVDFGTLRVEGDTLCIPAGTSHCAVTAPPPLGDALATVAAHIAHWPIRARGTFCGSLAHADPSAEWPLVFATLGGHAHLRGPGGERIVPAAEFTLDIMTTALRSDEVLTEIRVTLPPAATRLGFHEVSRRAGDYAMAMALVTLSLRDGSIDAARIGVGGAERRPRRIAAAEAALTGARADETSFTRAAEIAAAAIDPMEDLQVNAAFRRDLVRTVVRRALRSAVA